jgi:2-polyprenyl-3-methyl-5-hydroxy-6-metoxy-1,4-benzoquinol methylase
MTFERPLSCRFCAAPGGRLTLRAHHVYGGDATRAFWECSHCGIVFLSPPLTPEEEARFYRQEFEKFMEQRSGPDRDWKGAEAHVASNQDHVLRRMQVLQPFLAEQTNVLEIGCSSGFMLDAMQAAGAHCTGVEPSAVFTDYLLKKGHKVYGSLDALEADQPRPFDLITHFFVLEHIADPRSFIRQKLRLLKPEGRMVMEVPSATDALTSLYRIPAFERFYWSIAHHYYYKPKSLRYLLDELGLAYQLIPSQRYDLSNHMVWLGEGRPGGQERYAGVFSAELVELYGRDLIEGGYPDTYFVVLTRPE